MNWFKRYILITLILLMVIWIANLFIDDWIARERGRVMMKTSQSLTINSEQGTPSLIFGLSWSKNQSSDTPRRDNTFAQHAAAYLASGGS